MSTTNYLSALNYGASTAGSAGTAETTSTLGTARLDVIEPRDQYHVSGLQISRLVELGLAISSDLKGGTRVRVRKQTANPFGASESGFYISQAGTAYTVVDGVATAIGGGGAGDMVLASTQTVTGAKTFNSATLLVSNAGNTFASTMASAATAARTWTLPDATDTAVGLAATQTLTNKTLTAPVLTGSVTQTSGTYSQSYAAAIGVAQTAGLTLANTTAAAAGAGTQQWSPGLQITGQQWNGSASVPVDWMMQVKPITAATYPGSLSMLGRYNSVSWTEYFNFSDDGTISYIKATGRNKIQVLDSAGDGMYADGVGNSVSLYVANNPRMTVTTSAMVSGGDLIYTNGASSNRWAETWSRRFAGVEQTIAAAATLTLDPASGESVRLTLSATAINAGGIAAGTGYAGEVMRTEFIQDATGSRTLTQANFSASWVFAGGAYTVTATANKRDVLTWMWDSVASKWYEIARVANL